MTFSYTSKLDELRNITLHTPLYQNCMFCDIRRASKHCFFKHLSIIIALFWDIRRASKHDCSYTSRSELHFLRHPASFEAWLFHTPLNHNYTFCDIRRASKHDVFIHLSIKITLFRTSNELRHMTFSCTSQSELHLFATSDELRNMTFSCTSQSELHVLWHPTSFESWRFHTPLNRNCSFCEGLWKRRSEHDNLILHEGM